MEKQQGRPYIKWAADRGEPFFACPNVVSSAQKKENKRDEAR